MSTELPGPCGSDSSAVLGLLPPQREGQYLAMMICGTSDDPAERGHWSSPAHVQWRIDKALVKEREKWQRIAAAAQAVTTDSNDEIDFFAVPSHLMAALALALDEGPNVL